MKKFDEVKVDLLSNKPTTNGIIFNKESLLKAVSKLDELPICVGYDKEKPYVGTAKNFKTQGDYVVADVLIKDSALPTQLGLGLKGETSVSDSDSEMIFFTQDIFSISTISVGKHLNEGMDILE